MDAGFNSIGLAGAWWTSTTTTPTLQYAVSRAMYNDTPSVGQNNVNRNFGHSIRCLKDFATDITNPSTSTIEVYPNPVSEILTIEYKNQNFETVSILNSQGVVLKKEKSISSIQHLDFSKYVPGLYFLELVKTSGEIKRVKVINR